MPRSSLKHPDSTVYGKRIEALRKKLITQEIDCGIVLGEKNCYYFSGFDSSNAMIIITPDDASYYTDFRYLNVAGETIHHLRVEELLQGGEAPPFLKYFSRKNTIGIPFDSFTFKYYTSVITGHSCKEMIDISPLINDLRIVKDDFEVKKIKVSLRIAEKVLLKAFRRITEDSTEKDISNIIQKGFINSEASEAFSTIVAFHKNSANCHAKPSDDVFSDSDNCLIDMGALKDFYCSDITRTMLYPSKQTVLKDIFKIVDEAKETAISKAGPGVKCCEVDSSGREIIKKYGYGDYFGHSIGHGVGLEIHEMPTVSFRSDTVLKPGMIITIEPGIYLPQYGGVRIEDMLLITKTGNERLTSLPNDLTSLL